jgi:hypothetical protein
MDLEQQLVTIDRRIDSILSAFDSRLQRVLSQAQLRVALQLRQRLKIEANGTIRISASNLTVLRMLPKLFRAALAEAGLDSLTADFLKSFDLTEMLFQPVLATVAKNAEVAKPEFTASDEKFLDQLKIGVVIGIDDSVSQVAMLARSRLQFALGGLPFEELASVLSNRLGMLFSQARTIAATGIVMYYRTLSDISFQKIEKALEPAGRQLLYSYYGPLDKLTRPFCTKLMRQAQSGKRWTRPEIDKMSNGQIPDVFRSCGGWHCRHQWAVTGIA